jgi:hypothetical protein
VAEPYFEPRIGSKYETTKALILSESVYSWHDKEGKIVHPSPSHPTENLECFGIDNFGKRGYFTAMGRAICGTNKPSREQLKRAWDDYAYTVFVQSSVGVGAKSRPTEKQWQDAGAPFISLIDKIRPLKVIVTGKTTWKMMPGCTVSYLCDEVQAYKLSDGALVWCLAVPHPSNRKKGEGFQWERVGEGIRAFRSIEFPRR